VILGASGIGKSTFISYWRYGDDRLAPEYYDNCYLEDDAEKVVKKDDIEYHVRIIDTAGNYS
jgi:GTPase SAR1 family protein